MDARCCVCRRRLIARGLKEEEELDAILQAAEASETRPSRGTRKGVPFDITISLDVVVFRYVICVG